MLLPGFPGLLAPLSFIPLRLSEFASFAVTVCGTWAGVSLLLGGYKTNSTSGAIHKTSNSESCFERISVALLFNMRVPIDSEGIC